LQAHPDGLCCADMIGVASFRYHGLFYRELEHGSVATDLTRAILLIPTG
jgi:hypothetical protein